MRDIKILKEKKRQYHYECHKKSNNFSVALWIFTDPNGIFFCGLVLEMLKNSEIFFMGLEIFFTIEIFFDFFDSPR